jgi:hypothetical protein
MLGGGDGSAWIKLRGGGGGMSTPQGRVSTPERHTHAAPRSSDAPPLSPRAAASAPRDRPVEVQESPRNGCSRSGSFRISSRRRLVLPPPEVARAAMARRISGGSSASGLEPEHAGSAPTSPKGSWCLQPPERSARMGRGCAQEAPGRPQGRPAVQLRNFDYLTSYDVMR